MMLDRERFGSGFLPNWVHHEHAARWRFASTYVAGKEVADCACGIGEGSLLFAQAGATRVHAFDLSDDAVETTRARCARFPAVTAVRASGTDLPLADASVDVFVSLETIEHVDDDVAFVREAARALHGDGRFICSTPNRDITMPAKTLHDRPWNPFHVREYSRDEFLQLLGRFFCDVEVFGQNPTPAWRVRLLRRLGANLPGHAGGRINSALKLPRLLYDREADHDVVRYPASGHCEYIVAVCSRPRA